MLKFKKKLKTNQWRIIIYFSLVLFFSIIFFLVNFYTNCINFKENNLFIFNKEKISNYQESIKSDPPCENCVRRAIDGVYVEAGEEQSQIIATMIDNHPYARPPHGISQASLVYESEVEGGITRYLAIFPANIEIEKIGPVRSARPYFIDWLSEFSALFVHCGGSPEALVQIAKDNIFDFNEFYNGGYFWRDSTIDAPHNIFTSTDNINKYLTKKDKDIKDFVSWKFKEEIEDTKEAENPNIKIDFKNPYFPVEWKYDIITNEYIRYLAGEKHLDGGEKEIRAKNIAIQIIDAEIIDDKLRLHMDVLGKGEAVICLDGKCNEGTWEKATSKTRTKFYYEDSKEVEFNAGLTWLEIVRPEKEITY